jgi:peptide chain release factor subunit 1
MCVLIADDAAAQIWELHQREIREVRQLRDPSLRKPDYAYGMVEHRIHNKGEELAKRHHRRVAATLGDLFRAEGFDLLAVGGQAHQVSTVTGFLPRELRERLAGTFTIDAATATPADVRHAAEAVMDAYEQQEQRDLVAEITEAVAERRWAALGLEACLWAGSVSAIDRLAVQEGAEAPGVVCDRDGWMALSGETCAVCGGPTRATADVVDELIEAVTNDSGTVRHIRVDTDLRGLGARLRFPLPPRPAVRV